MECKCPKIALTLSGSKELIDTLWNVNKPGQLFYCNRNGELIDTLWNVNSSATIFSVVIGDGINRYIMECK